MMPNDDDKVMFTVSRKMRDNVKEIKSIMEEWASVLDMLYHHFEDTIVPGLPDNEAFVSASKEAYYDITSLPIEFHYVNRICVKLGVTTEQYLQYQELIIDRDKQSKAKRRQ